MTATGGPDVLALHEVPDPVITDDHEILVRIVAAGINPVDTKLRGRGTYHPDRLPAILGCDASGVVMATGAAVDRFRPGDEVFFCHGGIGGAPGNYAELTKLDQRFAARKPANLDFVEAAAAPLVLITAWESLFDYAPLQHGATVLVHGGAGGVGHVALQLAQYAGARTCTTVSSTAKAEFVRSFGVEHTVDYRTEDFVDAALEWTGGRGADLALDSVGGSVFQRTFDAVRYNGTLVTLLQPSAEVDWKEARLRNLRIGLELMLGPEYHNLVAQRVRQREILERCAGLFEEGRLRITVGRTYPLEEAANAHRAVASGHVSGKVVLTVAG